MHLTDNALILLSYISPMMKTDAEFPNYIKHHFTNDSVEKTLIDLYKEELIEYADMPTVLSRETISSLKDFLRNHGLPQTGKKKILIERIMENVSEKEIYSFFSSKYYLVTELGKQKIAEFESNTILTMGRYNLLYIDDIKKESEKILTSNPENFSPAINLFWKLELPFLQEYKSEQKIIKALVIVFHENNIGSEHIEKILLSAYGITNVSEMIFRKTVAFLRGAEEIHKCYELSFPKSSALKMVYSIETALDERTCDYCSNLEGKQFQISDIILGVTFPPFFHCKNDFCRCSAEFDLIV